MVKIEKKLWQDLYRQGHRLSKKLPPYSQQTSHQQLVLGWWLMAGA
jgi:hypothetical protein